MKVREHHSTSSAVEHWKRDVLEQLETESVSLYGLRHWFAEDPRDCVSDSAARAILRKWEHPFRPWVGYPSQEEYDAARKRATLHKRKHPLEKLKGDFLPVDKNDLEKRLSAAKADLLEHQHLSWRDDLRPRLLQARVPDPLADLFADYLCGYMMVCDQELGTFYRLQDHAVKSAKGKWHATPEWRRVKRSLKKLGGELGPGAYPPHREDLKSKLTGLMVEDLREERTSPQTSAVIVALVWGLLGKSPDSPSVSRAARRSRARRTEPTR